MTKDSLLYRPFQICRRLPGEEVMVYRCFELVGRQLFVVQNADHVRPPMTEASLRQFEKYYWELLCETAPEERPAYPTVEEAIAAFDEGFADMPELQNANEGGSVEREFAAEFNMYGVQEGGRGGPTPPDEWGCLLGVADKYFDCRVMLEGKPLVPGEQRSVRVKLLDAESARGVFVPGRAFVIFDGSIVGEGTVAETT